LQKKEKAVKKMLEAPDMQRLHEINERGILAGFQQAADSVDAMTKQAEGALKKLQA